jgi:hypothetical protein
MLPIALPPQPPQRRLSATLSYPTNRLACRWLASGLRSGDRVKLLASDRAAVDEVRRARDLPGLGSIEHEVQRELQRGMASSTTTSTAGTRFAQFEAWQLPGLTPPPAEVSKAQVQHATGKGQWLWLLNCYVCS